MELLDGPPGRGSSSTLWPRTGAGSQDYALNPLISDKPPINAFNKTADIRYILEEVDLLLVGPCLMGSTTSLTRMVGLRAAATWGGMILSGSIRLNWVFEGVPDLDGRSRCCLEPRW